MDPAARRFDARPADRAAASHATEQVLANVRSPEPLASLAAEFKYNAGLVAKVGQLERLGYAGWRRVRGDGNCLYRALGFGLLEQMVTTENPMRTEWAAALLARLAALRYVDNVENAAHVALLACIRGLFASAGLLAQSEQLPFDLLVDSAPDDLFRVMGNPRRPEDLALVRAMRILLAQYITENADNESLNGGISFQVIAQSLGHVGVEDFCSTTVLPLGVEAEDMILPAVPEALGVGLKVALLHRSSGCDLVFCDYGLEAARDSRRPVIHVQLRPGHYDLLYLGCADSPAGSIPASLPEWELGQRVAGRMPSTDYVAAPVSSSRCTIPGTTRDLYP